MQRSKDIIIQNEAGQRHYEKSGRTVVSPLAWFFRVATLISFCGFTYLIIGYAISINDFWVLFIIIMLVHTLIILIMGWFGYKNPASKGTITKTTNPLVSILIPVYNQKKMIQLVLSAIFNSSYKNIEVIAINDGSDDGTNKILNSVCNRYSNFKIIHKKNGGKRRAMAKGFFESKGSIIVLIDSDSIIEPSAITEIVKTFNGNKKIGAIVGQVKVWNYDENLLTKCQDTWYDFSFNFQKACETGFGSVLCCSGCLAGYRREAIEAFIPHWAESKYQYSDDRELTSFAIAPNFGKKNLISMTSSRYNDKLLTINSKLLTINDNLKKWRSTYVASAVVYTDVPNNIKQFQKQQLRWKKGTVRTNTFVSTFFWKRNPLMAFIFYYEFLGTFLMPLFYVGLFVFEVLIVQDMWFPLLFFGMLFWKGMVLGIDYKFRDPYNHTWKYKPIMVLIQTFYLSFLIFPALATLRRNKWETR